MARNVYSIRIFSSGGVAAPAGTVGPTVPSGFVYVVRDLDVVELTGNSGVYMDLMSPTLGPMVRISRADTTSFGHASWRGRQVYGPGEQVGVKATSGLWSVTISGYQLTLP